MAEQKPMSRSLPVPAGDDELREAEQWARKLVASEFQPPGPGLDRMARLMAEYDERGRELERLRALAEKAAAVVRDYRAHLDSGGDPYRLDTFTGHSLTALARLRDEQGTDG